MQQNLHSRNVALVIGATGVTGTPLVEQLLTLSGWKVYGVSRRAPQLRAGIAPTHFIHVPVNVIDPRAARSALSVCTDVTHVYFCANDGSSEVRIAMLNNVLDAVDAVAIGFANINLLQGTKYYGCHLGPFKSPAKESDPRLASGDFFYAEEDLIMQQQRGKRWTWTALRPHSVCGYAAGNPINLATVIAIYGSILRELGQPFGFPGTAACFNSLFQVSDAELLARSSIWVSTTPGCANQAFNITNGDVFRWKHLWPALAGFFNLSPAGPQPYSLSQFLADKQPLWAAMTGKYRLKPYPFESASRWPQGDYIAPNSRLGCEYDIISDTLKARRHGFTEAIDSEQMFLRLLERFRREQIIP